MTHPVISFLSQASAAHTHAVAHIYCTEFWISNVNGCLKCIQPYCLSGVMQIGHSLTSQLHVQKDASCAALGVFSAWFASKIKNRDPFQICLTAVTSILFNKCLFSTGGFWLRSRLIRASSYRVSIINFPIYDQLLECMVQPTQQRLWQALWTYCAEQMFSQLLAFQESLPWCHVTAPCYWHTRCSFHTNCNLGQRCCAVMENFGFFLLHVNMELQLLLISKYQP